jgi:ATP-dependent helicase/nuclease subunit A
MTGELSRQATAAQRRAADPARSVWVGANAGTGKTKVLTDRVLNLLLAGTPPQKILCLTFTKAAAAEMAARLAGKLSAWAVADEAALQTDLTDLCGGPPEAALRERARRLFAQVLDVPGGLRIETIHAFCQALLRRFPLEAGVSPHFEVLDDRDAADLLRAARESLLLRARGGDHPALAEALSTVTAQVNEQGFTEILAEVMAARGRLRRLFDRPGGRAAAAADLRKRLGIGPEDTPDSILAEACAEDAIDRASLLRVAAALAAGGKTDQKAATTIAAWLALAAEERAAAWETYCLAWVTKTTGQPPKSFPSKAVCAASPDVPPLIAAETARVMALRDRIKAATVACCTDSLLVLAETLLDSYQTAKERSGTLDFDDLILSARRLLAQSEAAAWVLYKLDGGIDHVLIDEAQDTNPDQWAVVRGVVEDFFSGASAHDDAHGGRRTIFAVGDRKQSIYSFQGADPEAFAAMRDHYAERVPAAGGAWDVIDLTVSFRSTRAVLDAVDAVFRRAPAGDGVVPPGEDVTHLAFRAGEAGRVEVWPPLKPQAIDEPDPWKPPVEAIRGEGAQSRLARLLARRIARMTGADGTPGEPLPARGRAIRPGDILVLVRRRGPFVEDLVRALKTEGVAVAGIDRMVLTEQMAVMDLMALAQTLLLPEDDLSLACVLKGPLIGLDEDQLREVAYGRPRGVTLWRALREKSAHPGPWRAAYHLLRGLMDRADFLPPHELFAEVLGPLGGREKLLGRLGVDAADPLDEFMQLALTYDRGHAPSLQGFLHWVAAGEQEIKRDLEEGGAAVRVMTVHGSKGLQAPIVILPDTRRPPQARRKLLWDDGRVLWPPSAAARDPLCTALAEAERAAMLREYRRLLYVALTRAEDRLIVCGWDGKTAAPEGCWYDLVADALTPLARQDEDPFLAADGTLDSATVLVLDSPQTVDVSAPEEAVSSGPAEALPDWIAAAAPSEPTPPRPLAPSKPPLPEPPARSPLAAAADDGRFRRGRLVHRLLESLPDLPAAARAPAAAAFLGRPVWGLEAAEQAAIAAETLAVLDHADFAVLFGPGSRAEVPVTGVVTLGGRVQVVSGQVDRLVVTEDAVRVVDFKTNRPPPRRVEDVPEAYLIQMALYRAVLRGLWPERRILAALLWTDGPRAMALPEALLDAVLEGVRP